MKTLEEALNYVDYHAPTDEQRDKYERFNSMWKTVIEVIWENVEPRNQGSPDKTYAIRKVVDARMAVNIAEACYVPPPPSQESVPDSV